MGNRLQALIISVLLLWLSDGCSPVITKISDSPKVVPYSKRTAEMIQAEVDRHKVEVKRRHKQMVVDGKIRLRGFISFLITIEPDGEVSNVSVLKNTFNDEFAQNMMELIQTWRFPETSDPTRQRVEIPYAFTEQ